MSLDLNSKYVIIGNYGNDTLALIQWALEQPLAQVSVLSVDTGWSAPDWHKHVEQCEEWVRKKSYEAVRLQSIPFAELIKQRGHFPTPKFQWCANVLKGIPILTWLDQHDPSTSYCLLLAHRRSSTRSKQAIPAKIPASESFGERTVHHPLIEMTSSERNALLARAGFSPLPHRSLECNPCINSNCFDLSLLSPQEIERLSTLELELGKTMFAHLGENKSGTFPINSLKTAEKSKNLIEPADVLENMGCGEPYGCGI